MVLRTVSGAHVIVNRYHFVFVYSLSVKIRWMGLLFDGCHLIVSGNGSIFPIAQDIFF